MRCLVHSGLLFVSLFAFGQPLQAQDGAPPPPQPLNVDERGINVSSGTLVMSAVDLAIGPDDNRGLRFGRQWVLSGWRVPFIPTMSGSTSNPVVSFDGQSVAFKTVSGAYVPVYQDGSTLSSDRTLFTAADGTTINFASNSGINFSNSIGSMPLARGTKITFIDGNTWTFTWKIQTVQYCPPNPGPCTTAYFGRLSSIVSSAGFQIKLTHALNTSTLTSGGINGWLQITKATAINLAVDYCSPSADTCSTPSTWPEVTYTDWTDTTVASVTDPENRTTTYSYSTGPRRLTGIKPPGASANTVVFGYDTNDDIKSVTSAGGVWNYTYPSATQTTVTDPAGKTTKYVFAGGQITTVTNALNQVNTFSYCAGSATCPAGLLQKVTLPEGNSVEYSYDARGNQETVTRKGKPNSGVTDIVTTADYPASCTTSNRAYCNKPTSTTDARLYRTDYLWDGTHGGLTRVTLPAPSGAAPIGSGARPRIDITYTQVIARYKNSATTWFNPPAIYLPSTTTTCSSASTCAGTANERVTTIAYPTASVANNAQPTSVTVKAGDNTLAGTTAVAYDIYGRASTMNGPLSGSGDTSMVRYNLAGQIVGKISPDPDDAGASKFPAVRYTYNTAGQAYLVETGTVSSLTDADWALFSATANTLTEYDAFQRPVRQKLRNGTTLYQVSDTIYDSFSRPQCSIIRMSSSNWGTPASSCSPTQTTGADGPDRVVYNHYDTLGRLDEVTEGYGTTAAATTKTTFTTNGRLYDLLDENGNRTRYEYDGHDRLSRTRYPHPTTIGTPSSSDDEWITYDANGNVLTFQTRRGETLANTFDNLNRLIEKDVPVRSGLAATHRRDVFYNYDLVGNMTSARFDSTTGEGVITAYDALGRATSTTTNMDGTSRTISYKYDAAGNLTRITHPDGNFFTYAYTGAGMLDEVLLGTSSSMMNWLLDSTGRLSQIQRWRTTSADWAAKSTLGYDVVSRLASNAIGINGSTWDTTASFTYNPASQLKTAANTNDAFAWTDHRNASRGYAVNGLNQYTGRAGTTLSYDGNGNLISDGVDTFVYDLENRLISRNHPQTSLEDAHVATLRYDPLGRLYEISDAKAVGGTSVTRFLHSGSDIVAAYEDGILADRYVHGLSNGDDPLVWFEGSAVSDTNRNYLYSDERGSVVAITDSNGAKRYINSYDEYGTPSLSNVGLFQYTGQAWIKELGLYYYKARMYSPLYGRFMQPDPIGYGDGANMYAYVGNDGVNAIDPSGLVTTCLRIIGYSWDSWASDPTNKPIPGSVSIDRVAYYCYDPDPPAGSLYENGNGGQDSGYSGSSAPLPRRDRFKLSNCGGLPGFSTFNRIADSAFKANPYHLYDGFFPFSVLRGTRIHAEFAASIRLIGGPYKSEVSYKDGFVVPYGTPGSVRADGIYGPTDRPLYAIELKSGFAIPTLSEIANYGANLPPRTKLCGIFEALGS